MKDNNTIHVHRVAFHSVQVFIPKDVLAQLGNPSRLCVCENPLSFRVPTLNSKRTFKVSTSSNFSITPVTIDPDNMVGAYDCEVVDQTVYLTKKEVNEPVLHP